MLRTLGPNRLRNALAQEKMSWQKGQAMVEVSVGLFFFVFIMLGVVELSVHALKFKRASTISREAALLAFEECRTLTTPGPALTACLNDVQQEIDAIVPEFFPQYDGTVIVSLYAVDPLGNLQQLEVVGETAEHITQYDETSIDPALMAAGHQVITVGEFFNQNGILTPVGNVIGPIPDEIYAVVFV